MSDMNYETNEVCDCIFDYGLDAWYDAIDEVGDVRMAQKNAMMNTFVEHCLPSYDALNYIERALIDGAMSEVDWYKVLDYVLACRKDGC